jgi:truncated hemoglobin YjbI
MIAVLFALIVLTFAEEQQSLCTKYSQALNISNKALVTTVVTSTIPGLVAANTPTKRYFDGTFPAGSTNFLAPENANALAALVDSLVQFFGGALGCADGTISPYTGPSMAKVHSMMGITDVAFEFFNLQVITVMRSAGVQAADLAAVLSLLESLRSAIVQPMTPSICDKYSQALRLKNIDLVTSVVTKVFGFITQPGTVTVRYFNGQFPQGSTNFLTNSGALRNLVNGLVAFFGGALGCTDGSIGPYTGGSLKDVHTGMGVTVPAFEFFNFNVIVVMRQAGVVPKDLSAVLGVLNSTKDSIVNL